MAKAIANLFMVGLSIATVASVPIDHQGGATSYVSLSLGGHSTHSQTPYLEIPQYQPSPVFIQKQAPAFVKVPSVGYKDHQEEYAPAQYEFKYAVEDKHTGDIKSQHEVRNGDIVQGEYSFHEADGTIRTVKYTADKHNGFNAAVERSGHANHPQVVRAVHTPVVGYDYYKH